MLIKRICKICYDNSAFTIYMLFILSALFIEAFFTLL